MALCGRVAASTSAAKERMLASISEGSRPEGGKMRDASCSGEGALSHIS